MLKLLQAHRNAYITEWYYSHTWTVRECWNRSLLGAIHMWYGLRYKSEMIDTPLWEWLKMDMYNWYGYKDWREMSYNSHHWGPKLERKRLERGFQVRVCEEPEDFEQDKYVCKYCDEDLTGIEELDLDCTFALCVPHDEYGDPIY